MNMQSFEIKPNVHWVGAIDWNIRDFHGYSTNKGSTYNAFLVKDEKIALFDIVKKPFVSELLHNIHAVVDPGKIDYLIVNHVEMDHSGALPEIVERVKPSKIICSEMGKKALLEHYHRSDWPYQTVKSGETLSLGNKTVQFLETRMVHWPDSMFSYLAEDRLLISSDGFGQHWATSERFDDQVDRPELFAHAAKYYANILLLYSPLVQKLLGNVQKMGLKIDMIAPDHRLLWRSHVGEIIQAYDEWSRQTFKNKAVVIYDTMWHSTESMAKSIARGLMQEGVIVKLFNLRFSHRSDILTEVLDARALIMGSATLNNGMLPSMADILCYMKGLKPLNKIGFAFGSYGWSGEAAKSIQETMEEMKVEIVEPCLRVKFVPTHDDLKQCVEMGRKTGKRIMEG